jgi:hypothetical protein
MGKVIVQEHGFGCGVACVAYVAGISYEKGLHLFAKPEQAETKGYWCRDLVGALARAKKSYQHRYYKPRHRKLLKIPYVIVYTSRSQRYPAGHYLVRTEDGFWMNPWANFPRENPRVGALQKRLPGKVSYIIYPKELELSDPPINAKAVASS